VLVGDVADVSAVLAASIFRIEVCRLLSFCVYNYGVGIGALIPAPVAFQNRVIYIDINLPTYTFWPLSWRQNIPPKRRKHHPNPHTITTKRTINITVRT
jgi:hypothetical protein